MITIRRSGRDLRARIVLPASKSISNRLLLLQFHYGPPIVAGNLSASGDTALLATLLEVVRQRLERGGGGILTLDARNAGTAFRLLTALLAVTPGKFLLTGSSRMLDRPVGPLVDALRDIGADIRYMGKTGFPPLQIEGRKLHGGHVGIDTSLSSQFLSALMLIAPVLEDGLEIEASGGEASRPYSQMTLILLRQCGIPLTEAGARIRIGFKPEASGRIDVEPDWSAAAFWYCMLSAADSGEVFFPGLKRTGLQGDEIAADLFKSLGILTEDLPDGTLIRKSGPFTDADLIDFTGCPDLALPVIVACAMTGRRMLFKGLERLEIKESDRLAALGRELEKTGITLVQSRKGTWELDGTLRPGYEVFIHDEDDHRVAMAFSSLAMKGYRVVFSNSDVVSKSYPSFWNDLHSAGFEISESC